jgi:hypothetical protein
VSEKLDQHPRDRSGDRDRCPACGRPRVVVLEGASRDGLPARFGWCPRHDAFWVQVGPSLAPVGGRHSRLLAREVLRLKGLLAQDPERRAS